VKALVSTSTFRSLLLLTLVFVGTEKEAHAYTDPGSGALAWQILMAAVSGVGFYCYKALGWLRIRKNGQKE
jgi:hypothetical protein